MVILNYHTNTIIIHVIQSNGNQAVFCTLGKPSSPPSPYINYTDRANFSRSKIFNRYLIFTGVPMGLKNALFQVSLG